MAAVTLVVLAPSPASAHSADEAYLYLDVGTGELAGRVQLPYEALRQVFGLELDGPAAAVLAELEANEPMLQAYAARHTAVGAAGQEWQLTFEGVDLLDHETRADGFGFAVFPFTASVPGGSVPQVLDFRFDPFLDEIAGRGAVVVLGNDWRRGVFDAERNRLVTLDAASRAATVDLGSTSQLRNFTGSIDLGVQHIRSGIDHIFFVLVLLLPAVLVLASGWRPAPSFGRALWRVLKIVTMFTVAHSITFTLAGLELLPLPPARLVEAVIGLSIVAAALHNVRPILGDREWIIAFVFGLFHGMGFASLVEAIEVDRATRLVSLLGRNLGIEVGQAVVILLAFPALFLLRRTRYYRRVLWVGSLGLAAFGALWVVERALAVDLGSTRATGRLVGLSFGVLVAMAVAATVVAALVYRAEARADRLLSVADPSRPGASLALAEA